MDALRRLPPAGLGGAGRSGQRTPIEQAGSGPRIVPNLTDSFQEFREQSSVPKPILGRSAVPKSEPEPVDLKGSECPGLDQCNRIGDVTSASDMFEVSVILKRSRPLTLPEEPFTVMSRDELRQCGANDEQVTAVQQFARKYGLAVSYVNQTTRTVRLQGNASQYNKAFGVNLAVYKDTRGTEFRAYDGCVKLPADLLQHVDAVLGLQDYPLAHSHKSRTFRGILDDSMPAPDVATMYNYPSGSDGTGQTIAIIELGAGYREEDLTNYFQRLGVPHPDITAVSVDGGQNEPTGDPNGDDGEVAMDVEIVGAVAPGAKIRVYFAPNTDKGFLDALNAAVHDPKAPANVVSISWGARETQWSNQALGAFDSAMKDAAALGVNVFCSSGDKGALDGAPDGKRHAIYPASSPNGIGCGATTVTVQNGKITKEVVWNDLQGHATGGGYSRAWAEPPWQTKLNIPQIPKEPGRGEPDMAANGDPNTGYQLLVDGQDVTIAGTSAVAPLFAALTARLGQAIGGPIGYLNPIIYNDSFKTAFNDVTEGHNGLFFARVGWDAASGFGSPDGTRLLGALKALKEKTETPAVSAVA